MHSQTQVAALVEEHLPLVNHIVAQVSVQFPRHVDPVELAQAGSVGLVQAAQRYEESRGVPFRVFAGHRIRGAILDAVRKADWAPRSVRVDARRVEAAHQRLACRTGQSPSLEEVAAETGFSVAEIAAIQNRVARSVVLALDESVCPSGDDGIDLGDVLCDRTLVEPDECLEIREMHGYLRDAVALLPANHRFVIEQGFFEGRSNPELASEMGVSLSRISQLRTEAFEMLRDGLEAQFVDRPAEPAAPAKANGRIARRKASYAAAISTRSDWRGRISAATPVPSRQAQFA